MSHWKTFVVGVAGWIALSSSAHAAYWNVFNLEQETRLSAQIVTYATLGDLLTDNNRLGVYTPSLSGFGPNIVGSGSDGRTYWNTFNVEGESDLSAQFVTYGSLGDMLLDTNRLEVFTPTLSGFGVNIIDSGSDGETYWNVFNIEGETSLTAQFATYATLADMLLDTNRIGAFTPNLSGFGPNIVGSGSDGETYWNVFNIEGETTLTSQFVTYATLDDMLLDTNRLSVFTPNTMGFGPNIIGSGSDSFPRGGTAVPEPGSWALMLVGFAALGLGLRRARPGVAVRGQVAATA